MMQARLGEDRFNAASALSKAVSENEWPINRLKLKLSNTKVTLSALQDNASIPEVADFLSQLSRDNHSVDSRLWHYFRYKYLFGDTLKSPADLDRRFDAVLSDREAFVYKPGERYAVYLAAADRLAYVQDSGKRISVYRPEQR